MIVDIPTGTVLAHIPDEPLAISWNGNLAVVFDLSSLQVEVIDWHTGKTIWRNGPPITTCYCPAPGATVLARPGSDGLAISVSNQPGQSQYQAALWLVTGDSDPRLLDPDVQAGFV